MSQKVACLRATLDERCPDSALLRELQKRCPVCSLSNACGHTARLHLKTYISRCSHASSTARKWAGLVPHSWKGIQSLCSSAATDCREAALACWQKNVVAEATAGLPVFTGTLMENSNFALTLLA